VTCESTTVTIPREKGKKSLTVDENATSDRSLRLRGRKKEKKSPRLLVNVLSWCQHREKEKGETGRLAELRACGSPPCQREEKKGKKEGGCCSTEVNSFQKETRCEQICLENVDAPQPKGKRLPDAKKNPTVIGGLHLPCHCHSPLAGGKGGGKGKSNAWAVVPSSCSFRTEPTSANLPGEKEEGEEREDTGTTRAACSS